jgi:hypothetical protein
MTRMSTMDFQLGEVYRLPDGESPEWFRDSLRAVRRARVGRVPITLALRDGTHVTGDLLDADTGTDWDDEAGSVYLEPPGDVDAPREFPCRELAGFYLVPEEPVDHSDELRGGV